MTRPETIDFTADLTVSSGSSTARVSTTADNVAVRFTSLRDGVSFWRRSDRRSRSTLLAALEKVVARTGKRVSICIASQTVAVMRPGTRPGLLATPLGLGPLKVRWMALLRSLLR